MNRAPSGPAPWENPEPGNKPRSTTRDERSETASRAAASVDLVDWARELCMAACTSAVWSASRSNRPLSPSCAPWAARRCASNAATAVRRTGSSVPARRDRVPRRATASTSHRIICWR